MKYFVVTVRARLGDTKCYYPENYQEILDVTATDKYFEEGGVFKRLHIIPDDKATGIVRDDVVEVDEVEAMRIAAINEKEEVITDEAKIKRIEIKANLGQELTNDELKAIDPNDSTVGINKKETMVDKINNFKDKEVSLELKKEKYA